MRRWRARPRPASTARSCLRGRIEPTCWSPWTGPPPEQPRRLSSHSEGVRHIHTYIHTYIHAYMHACAYIYSYIHTYIANYDSSGGRSGLSQEHRPVVRSVRSTLSLTTIITHGGRPDPVCGGGEEPRGARAGQSPLRIQRGQHLPQR